MTSNKPKEAQSAPPSAPAPAARRARGAYTRARTRTTDHGACARTFEWVDIGLSGCFGAGLKP
jgi:hypothetical protein